MSNSGEKIGAGIVIGCVAAIMLCLAIKICWWLLSGEWHF